jgi:hypothetical protein
LILCLFSGLLLFDEDQWLLYVDLYSNNLRYLMALNH